MLEPVLDLDRLYATPRFGSIDCLLDDAFVDAYLAATGEDDRLYLHEGFVPPLATALVRFVKASLGGRWPTGTLQLGDRMQSLRALRRGEALRIAVEPLAPPAAGERTRLAIASIVRDAAGAPVVAHEMRSLWGGKAAATVTGGHEPGTPAGARTPAAATMRAAPSTRRPVDDDAPRIGPVADEFPMARVRAYAEVAGARDPVHVDPAYAAASPTGTNIVQGKLVMTLVSRLLLGEFGLPWLASGFLELRLRRPVEVGERVWAWASPEAAAAGTCRVWCENARGEVVIEGRGGIGSG